MRYFSIFLLLVLGIVVFNQSIFSQRIVEDWEGGINPTVWKSFGAPSPIVRAGTGRYNSVGFDACGDSWYESGVASFQSFDLLQRPIIEFWVKGQETSADWHNISIGWSVTTEAGYGGSTSQPIKLCSVGISLTSYFSPCFIGYYLGSSNTYTEDWLEAYNGSWMSFKIIINPDSTVSFYRNDSLRWTSDSTLALSQLSEQAFVSDGRSYSVHEITDDYFVGHISALTVTLTPYRLPIQIPSGGGSLTFNVAINNTTPDVCRLDAWSAVTLPGGVPLQIISRNNISVQANHSISRHNVTQFVPASAPTGNYSYSVYVRDHNTWNVLCEDSFPFEKLPGDASANHDLGWAIYGWFDDNETAEIQHSAFDIQSCSPNPFNPTTTIGFQLSTNSWIKLAVYDITGREVEVLAEGMNAAGKHQAVWDASAMPSGMYFVRLTAEGFSQTQKMLLLK